MYSVPPGAAVFWMEAGAGPSKLPNKSMCEGPAGVDAGMAVAPEAAPLAATTPPLLAAGLEAGLDSFKLPREAAMFALTLTSDSLLAPLASGRAGGLERAWGAFAGMESLLLGESGTGPSFLRASMRALVACTASSAVEQENHANCSALR